jgi:chromosome segregation ATPase
MFNKLITKLSPARNGQKTMKAKNYDALTKNLERKEQLESELKEKQEKLRELLLYVGRINRELRETNNAINGYGNQSNTSSFIAADRQAKLEINQGKADKLEAKLSKAKDEMAALDKAIEAITAELSECEHNANVSQVIAHQKAIAAEQAELDKYQALIEEQKNKIADAGIKEDKVTLLIVRREELLADIALGKAGAEEVDKLDQGIARTRQAQEAEQSANAQIIMDANNTISGLERGAESIKARIAKLNHQTPGILDAFIMGMARQSADDFNRIAQELSQKLIELSALDKMVSTFGKRHRTGLFPNQAWIAKIPNINNVDPCRVLNGDQYHYFNVANRAINVEEAMRQLKQSLIEQGVNI